MDPEELAAALEALNTAWAAFTAANDERLKEIEKRGSAFPETVAKVDAINAEISKLSKEIQDGQRAAQARMDVLETILNRPAGGAGGAGGASLEDQARQFFAQVRGRPPADVAADVDAYNAYRGAFASYMRNGPEALAPDVRAALTVGSDPGGGYWVTPDNSGRIAELIYESSPIRQIADVTTIGTDALEGVNDLEEAASGWVGEMGSRSETATPGVGEWRIPVHEQYAKPKATQKLLDDAQFDVEGWLNRKVADKLARTENAAFVNGNGVLKPRGFLTHTSGVPSSTTWDVIEQVVSGAAGAFAASDPGDALITLLFKIKSFYRTGARWVMNSTTVGETRKLKDGNGNYLWQPNFSEQQGGMLLGYPIAEAEDMPDIAADSLSIAFGNFSIGYQIVDRQGVRLLRDPFSEKPYVQFYTTKRTGGDVVNFEAIKILKFAA